MSRSYKVNTKYDKGSWNSKWKSQENDRIKELGDEEMEEFMNQRKTEARKEPKWKKKSM